MARQTPEKCKRCAPLSPADARAKHPDCWDNRLCTARRFYINNRERINQKRSRKRIERVHEIPVPQVKYGVLQVWRENREDSPIHAIGVEIWDGNERIAMVSPVHCAGWLPSQVHEYVRQVLVVLEAEYGFKKFASERLINPSQCPIRPCPSDGIAADLK
jgi:hypothetical protein